VSRKQGDLLFALCAGPVLRLLPESAQAECFRSARQKLPRGTALKIGESNQSIVPVEVPNQLNRVCLKACYARALP
jgi:hypothetical protein